MFEPEIISHTLHTDEAERAVYFTDELSGYRDGTYIKFYPSGDEVETKGYYQQGLKNGRWTGYYQNGNVEEIMFYIDGELEGGYESFYKNTKLHRKGLYLQSLKTGIWYSYWSNGGQMSYGKYVDGFRQGKWSFYNPNGQLVSIIKYDRGKIIDIDQKINHYSTELEYEINNG